MEVLNKKSGNSIPLKQGVFHINSSESESVNPTVRFNFKQQGNLATLYVYHPILEDDNYNLVLNEENLAIIISEKKQVVKPTYLHNVSAQAFEQAEYENLKNLEYQLPKNNFSIQKTFWNRNRRCLVILFTEAELSN